MVRRKQQVRGGGGLSGEHYTSTNYVAINSVSILKNACYNYVHCLEADIFVCLLLVCGCSLPLFGCTLPGWHQMRRIHGTRNWSMNGMGLMERWSV